MLIDDVPVGAAVEVDDGAGAAAVLLEATVIDGDRTVVVGDPGGGFVDPHAVSTAAVAARQTPPVRTRFHLVPFPTGPHELTVGGSTQQFENGPWLITAWRPAVLGSVGVVPAGGTTSRRGSSKRMRRGEQRPGCAPHRSPRQSRHPQGSAR